MGSIARSMKRAAYKRTGREWPSRTQATVITDRGYLTLHPTRGWKLVSYARVNAQARMNEILSKRN